MKLLITLLFCLLATSVSADDYQFKGPGNCEVDHADSSDIWNEYPGKTTAGVQIWSSKEYQIFRLAIFDVADALGTGATITGDATCSLYCVSMTAGSFPQYAVAYECFKPYKDDSMSAGEWDYIAADEYTDLFCKCWRDDGSQNTTDGGPCNNGSKADQKTTPMDSVNLNAISTWFTFTIPQALVEDWYDGTKSEYGIICRGSWSVTSGGSEVASEEHATSSYHPRVTIPYTVPATGPVDVLHSPEGVGQLHGPDGASKLHSP